MSIQDQISPLHRVYVRAPVAADLNAWAACGWRAEPDPARAVDEHAAFRAKLEDAGAGVDIGSAQVPDDPDAIYAYDPVLMTDEGVIVLRPGKKGRRAEPDAVASDLAAAGIAIAGRMAAPATAEGGDLLWLDRSTLLAGRGYRTNGEGIAQLRTMLGASVDVVDFDLPHFHGPDECLHLMSFISPLDVDLAVAYLPHVPTSRLTGIHPDFRANGRIFASLHTQDRFGMVKLEPDEQRVFLKAHPESFVPSAGAWGRQGCTNVILEKAKRPAVRSALRLAWTAVMAKPPAKPRKKR